MTAVSVGLAPEVSDSGKEIKRKRSGKCLEGDKLKI